jgi:hypothetical protein
LKRLNPDKEIQGFPRLKFGRILLDSVPALLDSVPALLDFVPVCLVRLGLKTA